MSGLKFVACEACDTVFAGPGEPSECGQCGGPTVPITDSLGGEPYFAPGGARRRR